MTDEKRTTALAVVGSQLGGTLEERARIFQQMGAAAALGAYPAGYDTPNKVVSAAWMADALGMHPGRYMAGVDLVEAHGKMLKFPHWDFEAGILQERIPGYEMTIHQNDAKAADIELSAPGRKSQRYKLTIEDATRRGWAKKDGWLSNVEDHLFAKCYHRVSKRFAPDILSGVIARSDEPREADEIDFSPPSSSSAVVIEDEPAKPDPVDPRSLLDPEIKRIYGAKMPVKERLAKMAMILADAMREEFPEGASVPTFSFKSLGEIGPVDAERILRYIQKKWPVVGVEQSRSGDEAPGLTPGSGDGVDATIAAVPMETVASHAATDISPPVEEPYVEPPAQRNGDVDWTEFVSLVSQAKRDGRNFIKEAPPKSGRWHFVDKPILDARGATASVLLFKDGAIVEPLGWYADRLRELLPKELR